jgi:cell division protein ZapA
MSDQSNTVSITVMNKTYKVKCPTEKISELRESAQYLDNKMHEVSQSGKLLSVDRVAVIAALNIVHELLLQKKQTNNYIDTMSQRIQDLQNKIEAALEQ